MKFTPLLRIIFSIVLVAMGMGTTLSGAALAHAGAETAKEVALAVTGAKAVKLASKALKLAKASTVVGKVGEKIAGALPDAVGGLVPDAVKTTVQQAGTLVKKGANALGTLDRKLDTAVSTQVQKLRRRGATQVLSLPAPEKKRVGLPISRSVKSALPNPHIQSSLDSASHVKVDISQWRIHPRVKTQLEDPGFVKHFGRISEEQLVRLSHNPGAGFYVDARSQHINAVQLINENHLRITVPRDELKIISTGFIQESDLVKYKKSPYRFRDLKMDPTLDK